MKINAITVPPDRADELSKRFASRAGEVGKADGFEEFQLLRPADDRTTWLVYTRWRDEASFLAWMESRAFSSGSGSSGSSGHASSGHASSSERPTGAAGAGDSAAAGGPVATGSELWSFTVEQRETTDSGRGEASKPANTGIGRE